MLLNETPFFVLGVSSRATRHQVVEAAEERSLSQDPQLCARSMADLINPRQRLTAEVAWLLGVSPARAQEALRSALLGKHAERLPAPLAQANVLLTALKNHPHPTPKTLTSEILELSLQWDRVLPEEVMALINEDRSAGGFAVIADVREVQRALEGRSEVIREVLVSLLRGLSEDARLKALTECMEEGTSGGTVPGPAMLHAVADSLAVDWQQPLEKQRVVVERAVASVRSAVGDREALDPAIDELTAALRRWDMYAQPLQVSAKSRGQSHEASRNMASMIRGLSLELNNEHNAPASAKRLTDVLVSVFAEVPGILEVVSADITALDNIVEAQRHRVAVFGNMKPIESAPTLYTINGIGTTLYGNRDSDPISDTYVATLYFVFFFIPLFPLKSYRVQAAPGGGWRFLGSVPFAAREKVHLLIAACIVAWLVLSAGNTSSTPSSYRAAPNAPAMVTTPEGRRVSSPEIVDLLGTEALPRSPQANTGSFSRVRLGNWIDLERDRVEQLEKRTTSTASQLEVLQSQLDESRRRLEYYKSIAVNGVLRKMDYDAYEEVLTRHNTGVDKFNALLDTYAEQQAEYDLRLAAINDSITKYNSMK